MQAACHNSTQEVCSIVKGLEWQYVNANCLGRISTSAEFRLSFTAPQQAQVYCSCLGLDTCRSLGSAYRAVLPHKIMQCVQLHATNCRVSTFLELLEGTHQQVKLCLQSFLHTILRQSPCERRFWHKRGTSSLTQALEAGRTHPCVCCPVSCNWTSTLNVFCL